MPRRSRRREDPFGYKKEGMKKGDLRGAFSVRASTDGLVKTAGANSFGLFLSSFLTLLAASAVVFFAVRKIVVKPSVRDCGTGQQHRGQ